MSVGLIVVNVNNQIEVETIKAAVRLSEIIKQAIYLDEYISKTKESRLQQIHKLIEGTSCSQLVIKELVQRI
jgi:hypothetical protein